MSKEKTKKMSLGKNNEQEKLKIKKTEKMKIIEKHWKHLKKLIFPSFGADLEKSCFFFRRTQVTIYFD